MAKGRTLVMKRGNKNYLIPRTCKHPECKEEGIIIWGVYEQRRYNCIHHLAEARKETTSEKMGRLLSL